MHGKQRQNAVIKHLICQFIRAERGKPFCRFYSWMASNLQNSLNMASTTSIWPKQPQCDLKNLNMTSMDLKWPQILPQWTWNDFINLYMSLMASKWPHPPLIVFKWPQNDLNNLKPFLTNASRSGSKVSKNEILVWNKVKTCGKLHCQH